MNDDRSIVAPDVASGWAMALDLVLARPKKRVPNLVVRITDPTRENAEIRAIADDFFAARFDPIPTVANTIFPVRMAQQRPEPRDLATRYRERYAIIKRFRQNRFGTYFGRMVAFPDGDLEVDQLTPMVEALRREREGRHLSSIYELAIYRAGEISNIRGFPCLSLCSFHLVEGSLFLTAHYRNQYLVQRAYGNYLGLARLQTYIAHATQLEVGELMVVAGHASIDTHPGTGVAAIRTMVGEALAHVQSADSE